MCICVYVYVCIYVCIYIYMHTCIGIITIVVLFDSLSGVVGSLMLFICLNIIQCVVFSDSQQTIADVCGQRGDTPMLK